MKIERELDFPITGRRQFFTFADVSRIREAVEKDGANLDDVRIDFIRRTDLSGNPYCLYAYYEREK